ncbi:MAG: hypothetical protein JWP44_5044 [Mucilaginibacter sp.]|nr:hypothetical protein [Mucilaginibacter sp.]
MAEVKYDVEKFHSIVDRVVQFLAQKAKLEGRRQDQNNKTLLGEVSFWYEMKYDGQGQLLLNQPWMLTFDATPDLWNNQKIMDTIEVIERRWLMAQGVNITGYQGY